MKRYEFSPIVGQLLTWLKDQSIYALIGRAESSTEEQKRLWKIGRDEIGNKIGKTVTNCDGVHDISSHQYKDAGGRYAIDIFLHSGDSNIDNPELYISAHVFWISIGGAAPTRIGSWTDWPHFEAH